MEAKMLESEVGPGVTWACDLLECREEFSIDLFGGTQFFLFNEQDGARKKLRFCCENHLNKWREQNMLSETQLSLHFDEIS